MCINFCISAVLYGVLMVMFAYACSVIPHILEATTILLGTMTGPVLGLFTLGLMCPCANAVVGY